ncbi:hypothetical protein M378DRAFT_156600 [Amanita muscaria Koide BX008]|uniref:MYND-type domain-containing protein n=1 Tax=Amanita muscaria (strain Koide BX008) TaxID=946122 RepID=A0A0C2TT37_AMAMK|nr:hypothetical protein M378DRAFT_156600 [Amanita muscaria Koide BX008]
MSTTNTCAKCNLNPEDWTSEKLKLCSKCRTVYYCNKECQNNHWPIHKPMCKPHDPQQTWAIQLLDKEEFTKLGTEEESARFRHIRIPNTHPIFRTGEICPIVARCGIPLLIYSPVLHGRLSPERDAQLENQPAVYLRIEPHDAFAPFQWQIQNPGTVILARRDHRPLTREAAEMMWKWASKIIHAAGFGTYDGWGPLEGLVNPATFQMFSRDYYERQTEKGRLGFDSFYHPL